jgi:5-formyltetrahydrofolate cyclo-ligase
MKSALSLIPQETYRLEAELAAKILSSQDVWHSYKRVLLFLSMPGEFDTSPLVKKSFEDGKDVFFPVVEGKTLMRFYKADSALGPWTAGPFGILEPERKKEYLFRVEDGAALIVTPGLAFDKTGRRLGRGGGFYDRFFAELPPAGDFFLCGLCLNAQLLPSVPADSFDRKVSAVCTANQWRQT